MSLTCADDSFIAGKAAEDAHGWLRGVSVAPVAAAVKAEALSLHHECSVVHPGDGEKPKAKEGFAWGF